jgi:hypothetical protein
VGFLHGRRQTDYKAKRGYSRFWKRVMKRGTFMQSVLHRSLGAGGSGEQGLGARGSCWNRLDQNIGLVRHAPHERPCISSHN